MQTLIYGTCLALLMFGYVMVVVKEPSRLEQRGLEMVDRWKFEDMVRRLERRTLGTAAEKMTAPWKTFVRQRKEEQAEKEIAQGISYLRNVVAMGRGEHMGTELMISELAASARYLRNVYYSMANYIRLGDTEAAIRVMEEQTEGPMAADYGRLLLQWEKLSPSLLMETLTSHQKAIEQVRMTKQKKRDEMISDLIYFPVIMNVMLILINFIYVAYFIDQRDALLTMMG
ncbi:MAG: hypothetical protein IJ486_03870 [Firmicutes bacterium]|nr:hypothetical protein [Bacillota bacterium]